MAFIKTGICNLCGECCGYPRSTDGGQNNPWANDLPDSMRSWSKEVLKSEFPVFNLVGHPAHGGKQFGKKEIEGRRCFWIWIPGHGLCTDKTPHGNIKTFDQRCPFLSERLADGTIPCLLYKTMHKYIWDKSCQPVPPDRFETQEEVDRWFKRCPSCSYVFLTK